MKRGRLVVAFVFIILACGSFSSFDFDSISADLDLASETIDEVPSFGLVDTGLLSDQSELQGTLNPVVIEQTGNKTTATLHAETDSKTNVKTNLLIDTANDWTGSRASIDLWNLQRLYVENGSLSEGIEGDNHNPTGSVSFYPFGWDVTSYSPDSNMDMIAGYSNEEVNVIGNGYGSSGNYFFANGSYVYWNQVVNNTPYLENFILNFDFFYNKGPETSPNVALRVYVDDTLIWTNTSDTLLTGTSYNSGDVLVDLTDIGSQFEIKIGLFFDDDVIHAFQFIEFTLDNVHLYGETSPTFDDVSISLNIGGESVAITGTSTGEASITNSSIWRTDIVPIELTADLSYSFDYIATMLSSRYVNSTRSTTQLDDGVHYTSLPNENPLLTFYTFVGAIPDIDDFTLVIRFPEDWVNVTVLNPSGTPQTSSCIIQAGNITIPNNLILANLGWWEVRIESPNYLRTIQTFKLNEPALTWLPDTVYRIPNNTKLIIEIGGSLPLPTAPQEVGISWYMPNGTVWFSESISGGGLGAINSSQLEFGSLNATTGIWHAEVIWSNGTEVAFGYVNFEVHHRTSLTSHESIIDAESGLSISNFVYFQDSETGKFLMGPATTVTANWSTTTVTFLPDVIQNRWVGTFDTSLIGPGIHLVTVNATNPFFDDASCTFLVTISFRDNDLMIDNPTTEIGLGDTYLATFRYSDFYGVGIPGADVSIDYTGTADGITWGELNDLGGGNYSIEFTAVHSDNYAITISASKTYYQESKVALWIQVGPKTTSLSLENGTAAIMSYGEQYRLVVRYTNGSSYGLDTASVITQSTTPETGISYAPIFTNEGNGYYSIMLTPTATGTYNLQLKASLSDHEQGLGSFTLVVTTIGSQLSVELTQDILYVNQTSIVTLNFTSDVYGALDGAIISPYNPPSDLIFSAVTPLGSGLYSIQVASITPGSYQIVFTAYAANHNNATTTIILTVVMTPTQLRIARGTSSASVGFSELFELLLFYEQINGVDANISSASIQVNFTSYETLNPEIFPLTEGYLIRFPTDQIGSYLFTITASRVGYQNDAVQFTLFVQERAVKIEMEPPLWIRQNDLNITLRLMDVDTDTPVFSAQVSYKLYRLLGVEMEGYLNETSPGVYSISIRPQWYDGLGYSIRIFINKTNYVLDQVYEFQVTQNTPDDILVVIFLQTYLPPLIVIAAVSVVSLSGRVVYKRKKKAEFEIDVVNKRRFEDADNIIGVIVLHKNSGIPIYSQIVKGGFEEGIVAAFITAISHFREEFEMFEAEAMRVIPISDIIRAVQTRHLICAFVTVRSASLSHNRMMESFGMQAGTYLDDFYTSDTPPSAQDNRISEILNYLYDETMDGKLIKFHKIDPDKKLSKQYRPLEQVISDMESRHCSKPLFLAKAVSKYGVSEARGCTLVSEAIEKRLIVLCEEHEFPPSDIDLSKFLNKQDVDRGE